MSEMNLPCKAWVLTPGYAPKEIELVEPGHCIGYFTTAAGKSYFTTNLYATKSQAVEAGWRKLDEQMGVLQKRADTIVKRKATLTKHASKP